MSAYGISRPRPKSVPVRGHRRKHGVVKIKPYHRSKPTKRKV